MSVGIELTSAKHESQLPCEVQCMIYNETQSELVQQMLPIIDELKKDEYIPPHYPFAITLNLYDMSRLEIFIMADALVKFGLNKFEKIQCKSGWTLN